MLQIIDIHKKYGERIALDGVDLHVKHGETVAVMGPSGCGKSTLLHVIERFVEPDKGDVLLDGRSLLDMEEEALRAARRRIGFVFQHVHLIERLNVLDNVRFGLVLEGRDPTEAETRALQALEKVKMLDFRRRLPRELSGGQRQRAAIARALAGSPSLMLWDEPTAALDPMLVGEVLDVMDELVRERQTAMVVVTHEVRFARRAADRIVLMDEGRIVEEGSPAAVLQSPRSEIGRRYRRLLAG